MGVAEGKGRTAFPRAFAAINLVAAAKALGESGAEGNFRIDGNAKRTGKADDIARVVGFSAAAAHSQITVGAA